MFPGGQNCPGIENYCTNLFFLAHWKRKKNSLSVYCHIDRYQAPSLKWVAYCRTRVNGKWISGQNPQLHLQIHQLYPKPVHYLPFPPCGPTHSQNAVGRPAGPTSMVWTRSDWTDFPGLHEVIQCLSPQRNKTLCDQQIVFPRRAVSISSPHYRPSIWRLPYVKETIFVPH